MRALVIDDSKAIRRIIGKILKDLGFEVFEAGDGQQALGKTADVLKMEPQTERWQSFGWRPIKVDGHDPVALQAAFAKAARGENPSVVLARTSAGKGVSFMEDKVEWHYLPMTDEQYASALSEVTADR